MTIETYKRASEIQQEMAMLKERTDYLRGYDEPVKIHVAFWTDIVVPTDVVRKWIDAEIVSMEARVQELEAEFAAL